MEFEWDPKKARTNFAKHGLRFEESIAAFHEPFAWYQPDLEHSENEVREKVIGECERGIVVVVFTQRTDHVIRIISVRFATLTERMNYEERRGI